MADYRDLAIALGGGYGQDTGGITPDTLITLKGGKKATASDLLGMIKEIGAGSLSNLESLIRGSVAQVFGTAGDLEGLGRMGINKAFGAGGVNVNETPVLPTTIDILGMMPRNTATRPESAGMEELGGYMAPAFGKIAKPAVTGYAKLAGQEINAAMTGQPTRSLLGDITPKPKKIFIGENAKTWDKAAADQAVEMEKAGARPTDIWSATGTFRGPEGKLRQEISDVPAQLLNKQKDFEGKLHEVLSHEELFKQYPALQYYDTEIQSQIALPEHLKKTLVGRGNGSFTEKDFVSGEPKIEAQAFSNEDKSILLHELQHAIQAKEGFARGGNVNEFASGPMFSENAKNLTSDLSEAITGGLSAKPSEIIETIKYATQEQIKPILKKYGFNNTQEAIDFLKYEDEKRTPFGQYKRLAGEAEARATQERMGMTAEQRRAKFPYESYDVPINDLIVRK